jgi:hypothetical protein
VYATLLDEATYLCSVPTMYRLLRARGETNGGQGRRRHATHPAHVKPELVATQPNQVWSWDITKLRGPAKWTWHYLYVILDIYSRYVVGWMVASRESKVLAERLFAEAIRKQGIERDQLTIHADRGSSMTSKPVAFLLADLGITKSHSRPHVSNDNPYSESAPTSWTWPTPPTPNGSSASRPSHPSCPRPRGSTSRPRATTRPRPRPPTTPRPAGMRDASPTPARHGFTCACCGRFTVTGIDGLFTNPQPGSPARFCSPACRTAAWRRRRAGVPEDTPRQRRGGSNRRLTTTSTHDTDMKIDNPSRPPTQDSPQTTTH